MTDRISRMIIALISVLTIALGAQGARRLPGVVAHRGYWTAAGSAQNSLRSLLKADSIRCFGSEFDVWLTADSVLVVNHDRVFRDVDIERSVSADVLGLRLDNGETIPTLDKLLDVAASTDLRLVCELKDHVDKRQEAEAARAIVRMVADKGLDGRVIYLTFSKEGMIELIRTAPQGTEVYYLKGELSPDELQELGSAGMNYHIAEYRRHPEWIGRAHELGQRAMVWTVDSEDDMEWCIANGLDVITTNYPESLFRLLWRSTGPAGE